MDAYLILYYCIADILDHTTEFIRILDVIEEALNIPLFFQRSQILTNAF